MRTFNIKLPVNITLEKMDYFFEKLGRGLGIEVDPDFLAAELLDNRKVRYGGKIFDLFDVAQALQVLADKDEAGFMAFLAGGYPWELAVNLFNYVDGFLIVDDVGNFLIVKKGNSYLILNVELRLAVDKSFPDFQGAIACVQQLIFISIVEGRLIEV